MEEPKIIYEDKNFLGVYKPAGMLIHAARIDANKYKSKREFNAKIFPSKYLTLADWLVEKYPELERVGDHPKIRPGIVHRLDKGTSGILLVPRNQEYFDYFKNLFKTGQIKKTYYAVVSGEPKIKKGIIDKPIGIKSGSIKRSIHSGKMSKKAVTAYRVVKTFVSEGKQFSLLEVFPRTGRTHQIRVHLASIGHPIVGDRIYGAGANRTERAGQRLMLHASSLEFVLPTGRNSSNGARIKLEIEPDEIFPLT